MTKSYRMLLKGEIIRKGDEVNLSGDDWTPSMAMGNIVPSKDKVYRRPLNPANKRRKGKKK